MSQQQLQDQHRQQQQQQDLDAVRQQARRLWSNAAEAEAACRSAGCSSYRSHYGSTASCGCTIGGGISGVGGGGRPAQKPASPNRRNKPHPSQLFLTCRLHFFPEFNCSDCAALGEQAQEKGEQQVSPEKSPNQGRGNNSSGSSRRLQGGTRGRFVARDASSSSFGNGKAGHSHHRYHSCDPHPEGLVFQPTRIRGDFLIHPNWPPTLPHHHVP